MSVLRFDPFRDFDRLVAEQMAGLLVVRRQLGGQAHMSPSQPAGGDGRIELIGSLAPRAC